MLEVNGKIIDIIFQNDSNGYTVAIFEDEQDKESITVVGYMPTIKSGEYLSIKGDIIVHKSYGEQLEVKEFTPIKPSTEKGIINYLSSGNIKGIGEKMAKKIIEKFGEQTLEILEREPDKLKEIPGIGEKKLKEIIDSFNEDNKLREVILFFSKYSISPNLAMRIFREYKDNTIEIVKSNPYKICDEVKGIGFKQIDNMASLMGIKKDSKYRIYSGTSYVLNQIISQGHTFIPKNILIEKSREILGVSYERIDDLIGSLALDGKVKLEKSLNKENKEEIIVYPMIYYYSESNIASKIIELSLSKIAWDNINLKEEFQRIEEEENIILADMQKEGIEEVFKNPITIITGGPGTGKTTIINSIIKIVDKAGLKYSLAAPTGRAAKRMSESSGVEARTIHRLLEIGYSDKDDDQELSFQKNEDDPLDSDIIIIDEASMLDTLLTYHLLKAVKKGQRLVFVGDVDQLPSVGPGNILKDLIDSSIIKVVVLNKIFRQAKESMIVVNAHNINTGKKPILNSKDKDFYFIKEKDKEKVLNIILELLFKRLPSHYEFNNLKDIQVLTPMKKGELGTYNLNKMLQEVLNPLESGKSQKKINDKIYRTGDKVMQIKNNYSLKWIIDTDDIYEKGEGVFNGDLGFIKEVNREEETITVVYDDVKEVEYSFTKLDEIDHAYAITVHKSQGSEFPVVVMPIMWAPPMLITKNLLYTSITRAKNLVVLVGDTKYLNFMIDNDKIATRYSNLDKKIKNFIDMNN